MKQLIYTLVPVTMLMMLFIVDGSSIQSSSIGYQGNRRERVSSCLVYGKGTRCLSPKLRQFLSIDNHYAPFGKGGIDGFGALGRNSINFFDFGGHVKKNEDDTVALGVSDIKVKKKPEKRGFYLDWSLSSERKKLKISTRDILSKSPFLTRTVFGFKEFYINNYLRFREFSVPNSFDALIEKHGTSKVKDMIRKYILVDAADRKKAGDFILGEILEGKGLSLQQVRQRDIDLKDWIQGAEYEDILYSLDAQNMFKVLQRFWDGSTDGSLLLRSKWNFAKSERLFSDGGALIASSGIIASAVLVKGMLPTILGILPPVIAVSGVAMVGVGIGVGTMLIRKSFCNIGGWISIGSSIAGILAADAITKI